MGKVMEMEKQSRIQKYKDLRDEMKEEVAINKHIDHSPVEDDDFLSFIPQKKQEDVDDTLIEPLSYETLEEDLSVQEAINEAKVNVGKEKFNTRLDIFNKIKKEESHQPQHVEADSHVSYEHEETSPKMSLLEKLAAMSPEEDADELRKYEEETSVEQLMKSQKKEKKREKVKKEKKVIETPVYEEDEEDDDVKENKIVKVLNYVILVFIVIFLVLIGFIVKQMFF